MARSFDGVDDQLSVDVAALTGTPLAVACWVKADITTAGMVLIWVGDKDVTDHYHRLSLHATAGNPIGAGSRAGGTISEAFTTTGFTAGTWHHVCGIWASPTDRRVFIEGGSKGTDATSRTPAGLDRTSLGRLADSTPSEFHDGLIAEAAIWDLTVLTANTFETQVLPSLAKGYSPAFFPFGLVAYWPLIGRYSPEINVRNAATNLTITGAVVADHPRIIYPTAQQMGMIQAAAAVGKPWLYYARQRAA